MTYQRKSAALIKDLIHKGSYEHECFVRDVLADLMHYCDYAENGPSFENELRIAYNNYAEEVVEDNFAKREAA